MYLPHVPFFSQCNEDEVDNRICLVIAMFFVLFSILKNLSIYLSY